MDGLQAGCSWAQTMQRCCSAVQCNAMQCLQAYEDLGHSHVVNTAWAMLALMLAGYHQVDPKPLARHVQMQAQSKTSAT